MEFSFLRGWLSNDQISGICWTMLHSLWIGLIVAGLVGIVMAVTTKSSAALRYHLFCALLVLFILGVCGAGIYELGGSADGIPVEVSDSGLYEVTPDGAASATGMQASFSARAGRFFNQNSGTILCIWFVFFTLKSIKLLVGLFYVQRIRTYDVQAVDFDWIAKMQEFARQMGIKAKVGLIQSALVKVPVTLGYFKPVIVVPIGLLFSLPVAQVETILWHELAHIYRRDYLVNILQKILEALFFFNPALLWICALVREEREACCDDIVLSHVEQKTSYLAALVSFHGQENTAGSLAMAFSLRPNQLMNRLRRIVDKQNKRLSAAELVILVVGFIVLGAFTSIPKVDKGIKKSMVYFKEAITGTLSPQINTSSPVSSTVKLNSVPDQMVEVRKDSIDQDTLIRFKSVRFKNDNRDKNNREMMVADGRDNRYRVVVSDGRITAVDFNGQPVPVSDFEKYLNLVSQVNKVVDNKLTASSSQYENGYQADQRKTLNFKLGNIQTVSKAKGDSNTGRQVIRTDVKTLQEKLAIGTQSDMKAHADKKIMIGPQVLPAKKIPPVDASADKARVLGVIAELVEQKIVSSSAEVDWFALTDERLVVNGQEQVSVLHKKLKEKYRIKPDNGLFFGPAKVHGTGVFFDKKDL